ncbi:MAG: DUF3568 family protein [Desulfobacterales bacterium]|nr:DUF3568 family protein [Desulfobacterales bacterium]
MKTISMIAALLACIIVFTGCVALVAGTAAGVSVYTYINGELKRSYPESFDKIYAICIDTLEGLKINIEEKESDGIGATINAKRVDGTPVWVKVFMITPKITEVSVRSGVVGVWDKKVSELIHASIAQRLP